MRHVRLSTFALLLVVHFALPTLASNRVLVIGIDGAGGQYVETAATPHLDALASQGAMRLDYLNEGALTPDPPEGYGASGVNWSTLLTGAAASHHGVVDNSFAGSRFTEFPHFFQHVKLFDSGLYTASLANWTPINTFITPNEYADLEIGYDSGSTAFQDFRVKNDAVSLLSTQDPDVLFLHFDQVDSAGHSFAWGSSQHIAAIEAVDGLIGDVMAALNARPGVAEGSEDWLVLVAADHGASPGSFGHFASQGKPNWEVPFIVSGPSVPDDLKLSRGTLRDVATTALWHLGIDPFLAGLDGTVRGLEVLPPNGIVGDINQDGLVFGNGTAPASSDDVTAFVQHWLTSGRGGIPDRYARGDLNFDGVTDLSDWAILNALDPSLGSAVLLALSGATVPEPHSILLWAIACAIWVRRDVHVRRNVAEFDGLGSPQPHVILKRAKRGEGSRPGIRDPYLPVADATRTQT